MKLLVLGGTVFLGRHVVESALARGHSVTLFNRGRQNPDLFPKVEKLRGEGASYLAFTQHTFWWFQYYQGFRGYLEARYRRVRETTEYVIFDVTTSKLEETTSPLRNLSKRATTLSPLQGIINSRPVRTQFIRGWVYASVVESLYLSSP